jgi:MFS transporter, ACS family, tartrate transporter
MAVEQDEQERRVFGLVIRRLVPLMFLSYVVAYVDRVNISFAKSAMQKDLGLTDWAFGWGGGLFFVGYALFEVPSNMILERAGARRWIARIMITWGVLSMGTMFIQGQWSFWVMRVVLGLAEAGFFPGMVLYLTYWVPARQRAKVGALFMTAAPVAVVLGSPLSELLLGLDGRLGLHGWQWLFLVEGLPAVVLGLLVLRYLTDRPEQADWLPAADREWLSAVTARERAERARHVHGSLLRSLLNRRVALLCFIYFLNTMATYGIFLWLPSILREASGFSGVRLVAITTFPFVVALVGMVLIGRHSDRTQERKWHVAACAFTGATGLVVAALSPSNVWLIVLGFTLSQLGQRAVQGVFWAIPPLFLEGMAAAAGIAAINALGNLGGFLGSSVMGWLRGGSGSYKAGLLVLAAGLVLQAALVATLRLPRPATAKGSSTPG